MKANRSGRRLVVTALVALLVGASACADEDVLPVGDGGAGEVGRGDVAAGDVPGGGDVAVPPAPAVTAAHVGEWADGPVHRGERVSVRGVATVESGVLVSGRYLKFHLQDETGGVAIFADTEATIDEDGYDGTVLADVFVRRGDDVRVTGVIEEHDGLVELRPSEAGAVEILGHGQPLPAPLPFASIAALQAAHRAPIGALVRVEGVQLAADAAWPALGTKEKGIRFVGAADPDGPALFADIYPASGIPGSERPEGPFDLIGVCRMGGGGVEVFPRSLADIDPIGGPTDGPTDEHLSGTVRVTRADDPAWSATVDVSTLPTFRYGGRPAVLLHDVLDPLVLPRLADFRFKPVARDGRQPFTALDALVARQGVLVQTLDDDQPVTDSLDSTFYPSLGLSAIYELQDVAELRLFPAGSEGPAEGEGPCETGVNVWIQGRVFHVPFDELVPRPLTIDGSEVAAVPLGEVVSDAIAGLFSFDGFLTPAHVRALYDYELAPATGEGPLVTAEALLAGAYVPATRAVGFTAPALAPAGGVPEGLCHVRAERRFVVRRDGADTTIYLADLAAEQVPTPILDGTVDALPVGAIVTAAGVLTAGETLSSFDYNLAAVDYPMGVRFPWGHAHLSALRWWDAAGKTVSTDVTGDLEDADGVARYGGVSQSGWSSVKALLVVELLPNPDPAATVTAPGVGSLTDPATCVGCHTKRGTVQIPVSCTQCHAGR